MNSLPFVPELAYVSTRSSFSWKLIACLIIILALIGIIIYRFFSAKLIDEAKPKRKPKIKNAFSTELGSTISRRPDF